MVRELLILLFSLFFFDSPKPPPPRSPMPQGARAFLTLSHKATRSFPPEAECWMYLTFLLIIWAGTHPPPPVGFLVTPRPNDLFNSPPPPFPDIVPTPALVCDIFLPLGLQYFRLSLPGFSEPRQRKFLFSPDVFFFFLS